MEDINLKLNDKEINSKLDYSTLVLYDRLGGMFDNVLIVLSLKGNIDELENIKKDDKLSIITNDFETGSMYVNNYFIDSKLLTINSLSSKTKNKEKKSRIWRNVKLSEIIKDVSTNYGLTPKTYNIEEFVYDSISQINETDLQMLNRVCKREGYAIKVDNDCLIIFNEREIEKSNKLITLSEDDVNIKSICFKNSEQCVNSFTLSYYNFQNEMNISYTATDERMNGSSERVSEYVKDINEAKRFAYGYLRELNKFYKIGNVTVIYNPKISAGTIFDVVGFGEFEGKYIAYEVAHDVILKVTKMKIRKLLEDY